MPLGKYVNEDKDIQDESAKLLVLKQVVSLMICILHLYIYSISSSLPLHQPGSKVARSNTKSYCLEILCRLLDKIARHRTMLTEFPGVEVMQSLFAVMKGF